MGYTVSFFLFFLLIKLAVAYTNIAGTEARKVFDDAQNMLNKIISTGSLKAHGVVAFFPANSVGDDIEVYGEDGQHLETLFGLRQQVITIYHLVTSGQTDVQQIQSVKLFTF